MANKFGNCANSCGVVIAFPLFNYDTEEIKSVVDHLRECKSCQAAYDAMKFETKRPFDMATEKMGHRVYTRPTLEDMKAKTGF